MTTKLVPGKYKATDRGFIHDRLRNEGEIVELSKEFIDKHPKFTASWLELVEPLKMAKKPSPKSVKSIESTADTNI